MRPLLLLLALGLLVPAASAQRAVAAWYHVTADGASPQVVQARQIVVVTRGERVEVTADGERLRVRGPVTVGFLGLGARAPEGPQPTSEGYYETTTTTTTRDPDGSTTETSTTKRVDTDTGSTISETTTTTTTTPDGGSTTTTTTTADSG